MKVDSPNILLITIDCLKYDHLGCYGYHRNTSPNIDKLASKGVVFREAISNGGNTAHAFPALLTSTLPPVDWNEYKTIMRRHATAAEILRKNGYLTAAFHCNVYVSRFFHYDTGFDTFNDNFYNPGLRAKHVRLEAALNVALSKSWRKLILPILAVPNEWVWSVFHAAKGAPIIPAEQLSKQAASWLKEHDDKFFLWLHYMDAHAPYMPPQEYSRQLLNRRLSRYKMSRLYQKQGRRPAQMSASDIETLKGLYDACIRYVDDAIGELLEQIEGQLENTIIIITADHGDEFGEHFTFGHGMLYEGVIHVPLIIIGPGIRPGDSVDGQVCHMDIAPTIMDLVGENIPDSFYGESLLPLIERPRKSARGAISTLSVPARQQRAIAYRTPGFKYIKTEAINDIAFEGVILSEEVYNLKDDPGEKVNLNNLETREVQEFKFDATKSISWFKQQKKKEFTEFEVERLRKRVRKLPNLRH
ncbi:MAG: sulfatase [Dehalococcoidia bacterium]|nr:sulfatase [Dehalococcoidia bacterium]